MKLDQRKAFLNPLALELITNVTLVNTNTLKIVREMFKKQNARKIDRPMTYRAFLCPWSRFLPSLGYVNITFSISFSEVLKLCVFVLFYLQSL